MSTLEEDMELCLTPLPRVEERYNQRPYVSISREDPGNGVPLFNVRGSLAGPRPSNDEIVGQAATLREALVDFRKKAIAASRARIDGLTDDFRKKCDADEAVIRELQAFTAKLESHQ
jgi:hypothetical protein